MGRIRFGWVSTGIGGGIGEGVATGVAVEEDPASVGEDGGTIVGANCVTVESYRKPSRIRPDLLSLTR